MEIRAARPADTSEIAAVAEASWETDYPEIVSRETLERGVEEWYATDRIEDAIADGATKILVAEADPDVDSGSQSVVGFLHAVVEPNVGHLLRLYVHPDHRRGGVGRDLFHHAETLLFGRGVDRIEAMVLAENDAGNEFYRSLGFRQADTQETRIADETVAENRYVLNPS